MKLLNLSPNWVPLLQSRGWQAEHWSRIGSARAPDSEIFESAREHGWIVLTQDLDFAQLLFSTRNAGPSVILLRIHNEFEAATRSRVCEAIELAAPDLATGSLLTISSTRIRIRKLPIET
jgi:predicted nuclease of predicted toxin-antitoxin system